LDRAIVLADFEQGLSKLMNANRVCPGIHKVRKGPATRSAVAT